MTDIEDAVSCEHSAGVMHDQLLATFDRGEPLGCLLQHAYTEWESTKRNFAVGAFAGFLTRATP